MNISVPGGPGPGRPSGSMNTQTWLRIQRVARMEVVGIADRLICENEKFDQASLTYLRKLPEYQEVKENLLQGHLTEMDRAMAGKVDVMRQSIRSAVPAALRCLVDAATQRRDLKAALSASIEILDRDPDRAFLKSKDPSAVAFTSGAGLPDIIVDSVSAEADASISGASDVKDENKRKVM